ncbi:unnamed protein product [Staurois parvus]|uniref:Uncharacterized protein n=1 Tax=Staurois parvus TaxID=386267 RepID=A0ABN9EDF7_9NEOB|nr:unnamed protein product [Staurois parvus]
MYTSVHALQSWCLGQQESKVSAGGDESSSREMVAVRVRCTSFGVEQKGKEVRFWEHRIVI